jgi:hypothetical protein
MTSLVAWIGVDSHGPGSAYFASDSRLTWPDGTAWDCGRKLFACQRYPHILGYCGDVLFPSQTLSQIAEMIDAGLLFGHADNADTCADRVVAVMSRAFHSYPVAARRAFEVLYCMREGDSVPSKFHLRSITFDAFGGPRISSIDVPSHSDVIAVRGSGAPAIRAKLNAWRNSDVGGTSRAAFSAFCDSLHSAGDPFSGGPPQLVGLWRRGAGKAFGIVWQQRPYLYGTAVESPSLGSIRWYNELFEICDPRTLSRMDGAQPQPRPGRL